MRHLLTPAVVASAILLTTTANAQRRDVEVGTYSCVTEQMAGVMYERDGGVPVAGKFNPSPQKTKFSLTIVKASELTAKDRDLFSWPIFEARFKIDASTYAAKFSEGSLDKLMLGQLGRGMPGEPPNPKRAPNQYYGTFTDVFSLAYDYSFTAFDSGGYRVGSGGVYALFGRCQKR